MFWVLFCFWLMFLFHGGYFPVVGFWLHLSCVPVCGVRNRSYWSMCVGFLLEKNVRQRSFKQVSILSKSFCHSMSSSCTRLKRNWNSTAAAAAANFGWPKLLFIVQSNRQFQINVIANLPAVRFFFSDAKQWKLSRKLACKSVLPFYKKTKIKCGLEKGNDSYMTFITTRGWSRVNVSWHRGFPFTTVVATCVPLHDWFPL